MIDIAGLQAAGGSWGIPTCHLRPAAYLGAHKPQLSPVAVDLKEGQPDVCQSEAGDGAAQKVVVDDGGKEGEVPDKVIS